MSPRLEGHRHHRCGARGDGGGGDKCGRGHIEILDKAPTYYTKVAAKTQSPNRLDKSSNKEKSGGPENQVEPKNQVGPENRAGHENQVGPWNQVGPENKFGSGNRVEPLVKVII